MVVKNCFRCGVEKPLNEFYVHLRMADGHLNKCIECNRADSIKYQQDKPGIHNAALLRWNDKHPLKRQAQGIAQKAIKTGRMLRQPCEVCGGFGEAHHDDYTRPLDVRFLCRRHHAEHHRKYDYEEKAG